MIALVSVIIPSYNYGRFIRTAVDSALAQTYPHLEVIVVDDGSKDDTREVMQKYADNPRVRYVHQDNKGLPAARNTGIRVANGEFIALLDADDIWEPQKIARQIDFYHKFPEAGLVATNCFDIDQDGQRMNAELNLADAAGSEEYNMHDLLEFSSFRPSSVMMCKRVCEAAGLFDEQMKYVEDLDMWVRVATHGRILKLNAMLTGFRNHSAVQSMHVGPNLNYHKRVLDKLFATVPELQAHPHWRRLAEARMYTHVSWMRFCAGQRGAAAWDVVRSILNWPLALRSGTRQKQRWKRAKLLMRYATAS